MLTVLWRHKSGADEIFTADRLVRMNKGDEQCVPAMGDFLAHGVSRTDSPAEDYFQFSIEAPFGAVFVMNEKGRTVATYFADPGVLASCQADPAKLTA